MRDAIHVLGSTWPHRRITGVQSLGITRLVSYLQAYMAITVECVSGLAWPSAALAAPLSRATLVRWLYRVTWWLGQASLVTWSLAWMARFGHLTEISDCDARFCHVCSVSLSVRWHKGSVRRARCWHKHRCWGKPEVLIGLTLERPSRCLSCGSSSRSVHWHWEVWSV